MPLYNHDAVQRVRDAFSAELTPMGFSIVSDEESPDPLEFYRTIMFEDGKHRIQVTYFYQNKQVGVNLTRKLMIGGLPFERSLDLEHLRSWEGRGTERRRVRESLMKPRDNLNEILSILRNEGMNWLKGDYSREPYIPTHIRRVENR